MQSEIAVKQLIYFISIAANLGLGLFVFFHDRKVKINRFFLFLVLGICSWLISLFLFYTIEEPKLVLWLGRINFATALPIFYFLLEFALVFPKETITISRRFKIILWGWLLLVIIITLFTPLVSKEEIIVKPGERETVYGPLFPLYLFHYIAFSIATILILIRKIRKIETEVEKNQIRYILIGISLGLILVFTTNILLYSLGIPEAGNFGPLGIVVFSAFITMAILRYHLFGLRVILVESLVGVIALILIIQVVIADVLGLKILNFIIFSLFLFCGYLLIKSVLKEIEYQRELQKAYEDLKVLDKAKSEFISMASHQLRTPLSAIKGYISMMVEGSYGNPPEKMKGKLNGVFQSSERLIKIVNDLLNISKIELGKIEVDKSPCQLEELIQSSYEEMKIEAEKKGIKLIFEKPKPPLPQIKIDQLKIRQVILNLIDNAIRYTQKGEIELKVQKVGSAIRISVSDTGEGLTEKEQKEIFTGFVRGSAGINYFIEGAGLGLYVAKKFLELHQGKIWAESAGKGEGSTFFVELPIQ